LKVLITQSNYIPWKGYFDAINSCDLCVLYDEMQFTKRDWRNRNKILTKDGVKWLTIPVEVKGKYLQKINETTVSDPLWAEKHLKTLYYNYKKAPRSDEVLSMLEKTYEKFDSSTLLSEVNESLIKIICNYLGIETNILRSRDYNLVGDKSDKLLNLCKELNASSYFSGPAAKDYLNVASFKENGIDVKWLDYSGYQEYDHIYTPFEHGVTIVDLLVHNGKNSSKFMKSFNQ